MSVGEFETPMQELEPELGEEMAESNVGQPEPEEPTMRRESTDYMRWHKQGYVG